MRLTQAQNDEWENCESLYLAFVISQTFIETSEKIETPCKYSILKLLAHLDCVLIRQCDKHNIKQGQVDVGEDGLDGFHASREGDADPLAHFGSDFDAVSVVLAFEKVVSQGGGDDHFVVVFLEEVYCQIEVRERGLIVHSDHVV